ncbi:MAG: Lrp/AsnC ligand binding domain-containing protein [Methanothrix sp.]
MNNKNNNSASPAKQGSKQMNKSDIRKKFVIKRNGKTYHKFFLIKPKHGMDINTLADNLISLPDVLEVYATEGSIGFMVKARFDGEKEPEDVADYIKKNISKDYGTLVSYINFKRCIK